MNVFERKTYEKEGRVSFIFITNTGYYYRTVQYERMLPLQSEQSDQLKKRI